VIVAISAREQNGCLILEVENGGEQKGEDEHGTGVGLINVCDRLAARYGQEARCDHGPLPGGGYRVTISMPLVTE
jgi:LytS/YehU family sensor histidine kinase